MRRTILVALLFLALVIPAASSDDTPRAPQPAFVNMQLNRLMMVAPFVMDPRIAVMFMLHGQVPPQLQLYYVQVLMALTAAPNTQYWLVRNFPVFAGRAQQDVNVPVNLRALLAGGPPPEIVLLGSTVTAAPLTTAPTLPTGQLQPVTVGTETMNIANGSPAPHGIARTARVTARTAGSGITVTDTVFRGCDVPNIDLDSANHPASAAYAGDINACGPAAAANSMQWLEGQHTQIASGLNHREKMQELSQLMKRARETGVTTQELVEGKLAFIDKHHLPIDVKFQSIWHAKESIASPDTTGGHGYGHAASNHNAADSVDPTWPFLVSEMQHGEDVEMLVGWYDSTGTRTAGHWVTVTGTATVGELHTLWAKDDLNQHDAGGTGQSGLSWDTAGSGHPRIPQWDDAALGSVYVESIVSESYNAAVTFDLMNISFMQYDLRDTDLNRFSAEGVLRYSYNPLSSIKFLNVYAKNPDNGDSTWLIRNVALMPFPRMQTQYAPIDFTAFPTFREGTKIAKLEAHIEVGDSMWNAQLAKLGVYVNSVEHPYQVIGNGSLDTSSVGLLPARIVRTVPAVRVPTKYDTVYRGCNVPNIDLDSATNNPTSTPGYAGDMNACGPAAASNSLEWLERTHPKLDSTSTHREKLKELSAMMHRANNAGVFTKDFIEAKLAFIDKHKLPIRVKFQSFRINKDSTVSSPDTTGRTGFGHKGDNKATASRVSPTWDWLFAEMQHGEDVELEYGIYDSTGRHGGHWVTVTGVVNLGDSIRRMWIKDDGNQDSAGGTRERPVEWDTARGWAYVKGISTGAKTRYVESIVSESYDSTITFTQNGVGEGMMPSSAFELVVGNIPTPRGEQSVIEYALPLGGRTELRVFDALGRTVATISDTWLPAGSHRAMWDGRSTSGAPVAAGTYYIILRTPHGSASATVARW
jgi:hypothetical protein